MTVTEETRLGRKLYPWEIEEQKKKQKILDRAIKSDTFTPTGETLGYGCWGVVDQYTDLTGQLWAIKTSHPNDIAKKQMKERKLTEEEVMRREAVPLSAAQHHVVPRIIERDKTGTLFIGMPVYNQTLEGRLREISNSDSMCIGEQVKHISDHYEYRKKMSEIGDNLLKERRAPAIKVFTDIVDGISYLHFSERRAHGDIKPKNVMIDREGRAFISDLGSSTCISIAPENPRDNIGDANYRAPENYSEGSAPSEKGDVFSAGAIFYELLTGNQIKYGCENLHQLSAKEANRVIRKKLKRIPRALRKFLARCLDADPDQRISDGYTLKSELEKTVQDFNSWNGLKRFGKTLAYIALPAIIFAAAAYKAETHEPEKLTMPTPQVQGMLYPPSKDKGEPVEFEFENIPFEKKGWMGMVSEGITQRAKQSTENRVVAYLVKTHGQADTETSRQREYTENQFKLYLAHTLPDERQGPMGPHSGYPEPVWAKSIEVAMTLSKTGTGKVDLEDTMAISRVGVEKVLEAKRVANNNDWRNYSTVKDSKGQYVIPEKEQKFVNTWLAYFHSDVD